MSPDVALFLCYPDELEIATWCPTCLALALESKDPELEELVEVMVEVAGGLPKMRQAEMSLQVLQLHEQKAIEAPLQEYRSREDLWCQ